DGRRHAVAHERDEGCERLVHRGYGRGQLQRRALEANGPVGKVKLGVADELAFASRGVDEARPPPRGAAPAPRDDGIAVLELEERGEVVLRPTGGEPTRAAPDAHDLATGEEPHQVEAMHARMDQHAPARDLRAIEPAERGDLEALVDAERAEPPERR